MEPGKISVVVVSFFRAEQLRETLAALRLEPEVEHGLKIVVVDNGSRDATAQLADEFPEVRFNKLPRNFGLTRALNIGVRAADGEYVLLLHDDVKIDTAGVVALAEFLESRPDVAAVCPRLNSPQVRMLPTPVDPDPELRVAAGGAEVVAECVTGAAIMVRLSFLKSMGHVDERYGNYGSDIEICAQVKSSGKKIVVLDAVRAQHGAAASPMPKKFLAGDRAAGTAAFLGKHYGFGAGLAYRLKTALGGLVTFRFAVVGMEKIDGSR